MRRPISSSIRLWLRSVIFAVIFILSPHTRAVSATNCDDFPEFAIQERDWYNARHQELAEKLNAVVKLGDRSAVKPLLREFRTLAEEIAKEQGDDTAAVAIVLADAFIPAQQLGADFTEELKLAIRVLLDSAKTEAEADYLLYLVESQSYNIEDIFEAVRVHRSIIGGDYRQLSIISNSWITLPSDRVRAAEEMGRIAQALGSDRGMYEADALRLLAYVEMGEARKAADVARSLMPRAVRRLSKTIEAVENGSLDGVAEGDFPSRCLLVDDVVRNANLALGKVALTEGRLYWEAVEAVFFAEINVDHGGGAAAFEEILSFKHIGDDKYRFLMRLLSKVQPYGPKFDGAGEARIALEGAEILKSQLEITLARELLLDAERWTRDSDRAHPAARLTVLNRLMRLDWQAERPSTAYGAIEEAERIVESRAHEIPDVELVQFRLTRAELAEARLLDANAADDLSKAIAKQPPDEQQTDFGDQTINYEGQTITGLLRRHLEGDFCQACGAELGAALSSWWERIVTKDSVREDSDVAEFVFLVMASSSSAVSPQLRDKAQMLLSEVGYFGYVDEEQVTSKLSATARGERERIMLIALVSLFPSDIALYVPETDLQTLSLIEADNAATARKTARELLVTAANRYALFADGEGAFEQFAGYARLLRIAGYPSAAHAIEDASVWLSQPESKTSDWNPPSQNERFQLARILGPAYVRTAEYSLSEGRLADAWRELDRGQELMKSRLDEEWTSGNEQATIYYRAFQPSLQLAGELRFRLAELSDPATRADRTQEAFRDLQFAVLGELALATQAVVRNRILREPSLAEAIKQRDDAQIRLQHLEAIESAVPTKIPWKIEQLRAAANGDLATATRALEQGLKKTVSFATMSPVGIPSVQHELKRSEALFLLHAGRRELFAIVLRSKGQPLLFRSAMGSEELKSRVAKLRADASNFGAVDMENAALLFDHIFRPAEALLSDVDHVIVVGNGSLPALPWAMLSTESTTQLAIPHEGQSPSRRSAKSLHETAESAARVGFSERAWLIRRFPVSVAPSVASFVAQRSTIGRSMAPLPFLGVGNPLLGGRRPSEAVDVASIYGPSRNVDSYVLSELSPLPETEDEIRQLATILGAGAETVLLGARASEPELAKLRLSDYRVIAFATHGILAGEISGTSEPGLVLTPERSGNSRATDGYLALSEIASLVLDADLVILSACNTGGSDGRPRAEWLTGLARGFIAAGARQLVITLWSIPSDPTTRLVTGMAAAYRPDTGWPQALQASILEMIDHPTRVADAHPASWAAFTVLGAGI